MKNLLPELWVLGINYRDTTTEQRSLFAICDEKYQQLLDRAPQFNLQELFVLSTCNRTELYAMAKTPQQLASLVADVTGQSVEVIQNCAYVRNGDEVVEHLYCVTAGLDS